MRGISCRVRILCWRHVQVASAEFDRQGQEYDRDRLIEQITETLKVWLRFECWPFALISLRCQTGHCALHEAFAVDTENRDMVAMQGAKVLDFLQSTAQVTVLPA